VWVADYATYYLPTKYGYKLNLRKQLNGHISGQPRKATILDFIGAWMTEVMAKTGAIRNAKLQSNRHHQNTNTKLFYRPNGLPVPQPTVS